jgi:hypothetical protein
MKADHVACCSSTTTACITSEASMRPSSAARIAYASRANASTSASRACTSSNRTTVCGRDVVVVARAARAQLRAEFSSTIRSSARIADRISVTVSCVATASYSAVESSTRLRPIRPASRATSNAVSKIRFGRSDRRSRARMSTSTVCTNPA